jgi:hypothetical protein
LHGARRFRLLTSARLLIKKYGLFDRRRAVGK